MRWRGRPPWQRRVETAKLCVRPEWPELSRWTRDGLCAKPWPERRAPGARPLPVREAPGAEEVLDLRRPLRFREKMEERWPGLERFAPRSLRACREYIAVGTDKDEAEVVVSLGDYLSYAETTRDDSPLYAFDGQILHSDHFRGAFAKPQCFGEDLMGLLEEDRPPFAWLLVGAPRSGSAPHVDPFATAVRALTPPPP